MSETNVAVPAAPGVVTSPLGVLPVLEDGSTGPEVRTLQMRLLELGFPPGRIDGEFGGGTEAAVLAFQRSKGLLPDGVVGARTAAALGFTPAPHSVPAMPTVTVAIASKMFPGAPPANIKTHLPIVLA